jgi:hypothetical protein
LCWTILLRVSFVNTDWKVSPHSCNQVLRQRSLLRSLHSYSHRPHSTGRSVDRTAAQCSFGHWAALPDVSEPLLGCWSWTHCGRCLYTISQRWHHFHHSLYLDSRWTRPSKITS